MQLNKTILISFATSILLLAGSALYINSREEAVGGKVESADPVILKWTKPNTDAQWAEDIKAEQLDIRPDAVLDEMIVSHTKKLAREEEAFKKFTMCPDCAYYEYYKGFIDSGWTEQEALAEATKQAQESYDNALYSVERLKQVIERMEKEKELREKDFVVTQEEIDAKNLKNIDPSRIRKFIP